MQRLCISHSCRPARTVVLALAGFLATGLAAAADNLSAPATPQALIETVSDAKRFPVYDAAHLQGLVERFNQAQLRRYKIDAEQMIGLPQGFASAQFEEVGPYFAVRFKQVETTHTDDIGVDGGADKYFSAFWPKKNRVQAVVADGLTYAFDDPRLQLVVPTHADCAGDSPTDGFNIQDLSSGDIWLAAELPLDTVSIVNVSTGSANEISFEVQIETAFDTSPADEHQCEVGYWVKKASNRYTVHCDPKDARCTLKKGRARIEQGCSSVSACD